MALALTVFAFASPVAVVAQDLDDDDEPQPEGDRDPVEPETPPEPRESFELLGRGQGTSAAWGALDGGSAKTATAEALAVVKSSENADAILGAALYLRSRPDTRARNESADLVRARFEASKGTSGVRSALAEALGVVGSAKDVGGLAEVAAGGSELALSAAKGLCRNRSGGGLDRLVLEAVRLQAGNAEGDSEALETLCMAVRAVAADRSATSAEFVRAIGASDAPSGVLTALASAGTPEAREALKEISRQCVASDDPLDRVVGLELLVASVDRASTESILFSLGDEDPAVRRAAAAAASALTVKEALPALVELLRNVEDPEGIAAARKALVSITGAELSADPALWAAWLEARGLSGVTSEDDKGGTAATTPQGAPVPDPALQDTEVDASTKFWAGGAACLFMLVGLVFLKRQS
jgi:hypothetical protein